LFLQIFELLEDKQLFSHLKSQNNVYTAKAHLGEMIGLLGPPPSKLIEQAAYWSDIPWERSFPGGNGKWCNTAREYYRGPFFDSKGMWLLPTIYRAVQLIFMQGFLSILMPFLKMCKSKTM